jgi:hypothetical protein
MRNPERCVGLIVLFAVGAAACGSTGSATGTTSGSPVHAIETAYTAALRAKTAKVDFTASTRSDSTSGANESATVTGSGELDLTDQGYDLTVNSPSGGSIQVLQVGAIEYIQVPPAQQSTVPGHLPWESIDLNQVDEAKLGRSASQLASIDSDNPGQVLSNLTGVSNSVTDVGSATLEGVPTTEYRAQVSLAKDAARATANAGPKAGAVVTQEAQALGTNTIPVEVWIDAQGLPRRVSERIPVPAASTGATDGSGSVTVTMSFSDYGVPVTLTPPPADQVADITAQAVQQARAAGT